LAPELVTLNTCVPALSVVLATSHEVSVASDRATLAFRSYYLSTLKPSGIAAPGHPAAASRTPPPGDGAREAPEGGGLTEVPTAPESAAEALARGQLAGRA